MSDLPANPDPPFPKRAKWFWLRVAVSTFFGLLTVALCVLWVRSYTRSDSVWLITPTRPNSITAKRGRVVLSRHSPFRNKGGATWWHQVEMIDDGIFESEWDGFHGFAFSNSSSETLLQFPFWFAVVQTTFLMSLPWLSLLPLSSRFSLRTMLIATTLVAVVLGVMTWKLRS